MTDRLPPHDPEAEAALIGCVLQADAEHLNAMLAELQLDGFYDLRHRTIWETVERMAAAGQPINLPTVAQRLRAEGLIERAGGLPHLTECVDSTPSPASWLFFHDHVRDCHTRRRLAAVCYAILAQTHAENDAATILLDAAERQIMGVRGAEIREEADIRALTRAVGEDLERDFHDGDAPRGLLTGIPSFDHWTRGLKPQNLVVIAARPAVGKTSLAMQIATRLAMGDRQPVGIFSMEMSGKELVERAAKQRSGVFETRNINELELGRLTQALVAIGAAPLHVCDEGGLTIGQIQARARRWHQRHKLALIVVDYIQLVSCPGKENRATELGRVSGGLKALAKQLNIPVIALAQVNRASEKEERAPRLSDLRESGAIEQDADIVGMLHTTSDEGTRRLVDLRIEKHRGGRRGIIPLEFDGALTEFREVIKDVTP